MGGATFNQKSTETNSTTKFMKELVRINKQFENNKRFGQFRKNMFA